MTEIKTPLSHGRALVRRFDGAGELVSERIVTDAGAVGKRGSVPNVAPLANVATLPWWARDPLRTCGLE